MKHPELDVALIDGERYGVEQVPYRKHLDEAIEYFQVGLQILFLRLQ